MVILPSMVHTLGSTNQSTKQKRSGDELGLSVEIGTTTKIIKRVGLSIITLFLPYSANFLIKASILISISGGSPSKYPGSLSPHST